MNRERAGSAAMCGGLMLFGFAIGGIAGLSKTPVASGLLTSTFGFVGGVLLSFAGFTIVDSKRDSEKPRVNTLYMGLALAAFSLGLSGGIIAGLMARFHHPGIVEDHPEPTEEKKPDAQQMSSAQSAPEKKVSRYVFGLEADDVKLCANITKEIADKQYATDPGLAPARVEQLHHILCVPAK